MVIGGSGSDIIYGGGGNDTMTGGTEEGGDGDQDIFVFGSSSYGDHDVITDFEVGIDKIDMTGMWYDWEYLTTEAQFTAPEGGGDTLQQVGDDVLIYTDWGSTLTLQNTDSTTSAKPTSSSHDA